MANKIENLFYRKDDLEEERINIIAELNRVENDLVDIRLAIHNELSHKKFLENKEKTK